MPYPKTEPRAQFIRLEHEILDFWRTRDIFHKSLAQTKNGKHFTFFDGPPFANGVPHWGHVGVSAMKDLVFRYKTMRGMYVLRELGWDCHGLPAEQSVEKARGALAKDIVADAGMDGFCDMCRADVLKYTEVFKNVYEREGRWVEKDAKSGYATMNKDYMESVIWALKQLYDKGLLYKDYQVSAFDWKLGTILSNSEAAQEYQDVVDDSVSVWFELLDGRRVVAWTTTPWTLPANEALAVNPKIKYVETDNGYIIAASRISAYDKEPKIKKEFLGAELVGLRYKPLFDYYAKFIETGTGIELFQIISADYVSDSDGTGIVHIAPAFGQEDFWALKSIDPRFPVIVNVDEYGNFDASVRDWAGQNIFAATPAIVTYLKESGFLIKKEPHKHSYPYSYRTHEKLIYRAADSWYIDVPKIKERLISNNKLVDWKSAGERFAKWLEGARPWAISRSRFWGTPLPIWERQKTEGQAEYKVFGSIKEIEDFFGLKINDLHRPALDVLEKNGWKRVHDVLDCWVESGSMPFAQLHYPFENADKFNATFPADYIIEGPDQTRGWFYSLMVLATALFDKPAFKVVSVNGLILDENKKKMSKSLGNYEDPSKILETYGADAVRLYILGSQFMKCEPVPVDKAGKVFNEPIKNLLTPLWNAYHFFTLYANAANINAEDKRQKAENVLDRYILMELNELTGATSVALDAYQPDATIKEFVRFLDILNNWYIRRSRERFWNEDQAVFDTLWLVLTEFCKLLAPFAPFISDYIYRSLTGKESVHLEKWPEKHGQGSDKALMENMRRVQNIVATGKMLREKYKLRNRLPLRNLEIAGWNDSAFDEIIRDELNVKQITHAEKLDAVADSFVFPLTPKIATRLGGATLKEILPAIKNDGMAAVEKFRLLPDEYELRLNVKSGITGAALPDNTAAVILDTTLTPELVQEGLANDALRFIQDSRKTAGLNVSDRIRMVVAGDAEMLAAIRAHESRIVDDILAAAIEYADVPLEYKTEIEGHGFSIKIEIIKI